jgi:hypothetical protein
MAIGESLSRQKQFAIAMLSEHRIVRVATKKRVTNSVVYGSCSAMGSEGSAAHSHHDPS